MQKSLSFRNKRNIYGYDTDMIQRGQISRFFPGAIPYLNLYPGHDLFLKDVSQRQRQNALENSREPPQRHRCSCKKEETHQLYTSYV